MDKNSSINILCATDNNYAPYCGIMLTSLFENNKEENIHVHILEDNNQISKRNKRKFQQLCDMYHQTITYIHVDSSIFDKYPTHGLSQWKTNVYYRLLAADLLPQSVEKILYLDCDIIVQGKIFELWNISIDDYAIASVDDASSSNQEHYERLEYPQSYGYFNAGVLLMNLNYWRKNEVSTKLMNYLASNYEKLVCNDQDILNAVLHKERLRLTCVWNYMTYYFRTIKYYNLPKKIKIELVEASYPIIIHYCDIDKPWTITYGQKPFNLTWLMWKKKSHWRYMFLEVPKRHWLQKVIKKYVFWPLGLFLDRDTQYVEFWRNNEKII